MTLFNPILFDQQFFDISDHIGFYLPVSGSAATQRPSQLIPLPGGAADMATDDEVLAMLAELGALPVAADSDGAVIVDANGTIVM